MKILFKLNPYNQQRQTYKSSTIYPVLLAMFATYLKQQNSNEVVWDGVDDGTYDRVITSESDIDAPFLELPPPDRVFTKALNPRWQDNGNFKALGTYIQSALDCSYGKCSFCRYAEMYPFVKIRSVESVLDEIGMCIDLGFREIFDDSGTFPGGMWTLKFCNGMISRGYNEKIRIGCNMRLDYMHPNDSGMRYMREAGFRMVLYGLESANQSTLDFINKGINIHSAIDNIKRSARCGLEPHLAVMFGFPNETYKDALKTLNLVKWLLVKGYAKTAQASVLTPFPRTPLYKQYPTIQVDYDANKLCKRIYECGWYPEFWIRKLCSIRNMNDVRYLWKSIRKALA